MTNAPGVSLSSTLRGGFRPQFMAVILADMDAHALYPLTNDLPKSLLPILNRPLLQYQLDLLHASGPNLPPADPLRTVDVATLTWQREVEAGFGVMLSKILPMLKEGGRERVTEEGDLLELMRKARELDARVG
ncbi:hypothetical protein NSK_008306 [Nannochloropsis salina CCMP1776]|uniref:Nucleotidyl transferase domain-containing protein n=1 Tax=Nannochloropsis salina CCMP1776 TaxID=1027361 RepID=A0A4D9CML3_9STRA|nr:hypothetical protein NSK_008306 [Nannochloropsis salina CCMP1776]|eukprot:TFJ80360.1 hypothetical protein NSK_008306 [Nannochloropsis salina CCMP1776]